MPILMAKRGKASNAMAKRAKKEPKYPSTKAGLALRRIEVDVMTEQGMNRAAIAKALGISPRLVDHDRAYMKRVAEYAIHEYIEDRLAGRLMRADAFHARALDTLDSASFKDASAAAAREDIAADRMVGIKIENPPPPKPKSPKERREHFYSVMLGDEEDTDADMDIDTDADAESADGDEG